MAASVSQSLRARSVARILKCKQQMEGGGFPVRRPPIDNIGGLILLFDHMGPMVLAPGEDFPGHDHPHRGFETISYHIQGTLEHHCSSGATGIMGPGAAQWMTAGRGVVHGGNVPAALKAKGQTVEAFQIWINLPAAKKMMQPRYQDLAAHELPVYQHMPGRAGGTPSTVKVIAGQYGGIAGKVSTQTPVSMLDVRLQPGDSLPIRIPAGHVGIVYCYRGTATVGPDASVISEGYAAPLEELSSGSDSELTELTVGAASTAPLVYVSAPHRIPAEATEGVAAGLIVLFGAPLNEPVARYGPFVMNTQAEIQQAFEDYKTGKMGKESRLKHEQEL